MACSNFIDYLVFQMIIQSLQLNSPKNNIKEVIDWKPVPSDKRYEERLTVYTSGRKTKVTRIAGQTTNYPHYTQYYNAQGKSEVNRTHKSEGEGKNFPHRDAHKTVDAIFADLDEAIKSLRSSR